MALTHEYGLMLIKCSSIGLCKIICLGTWLDIIEVSLIYLMMYYWKHMVLLDIMVHAFCMWLNYILGHAIGELICTPLGVIAC
jgi:hypothetical protein